MIYYHRRFGCITLLQCEKITAGNVSLFKSNYFILLSIGFASMDPQQENQIKGITIIVSLIINIIFYLQVSRITKDVLVSLSKLECITTNTVPIFLNHCIQLVLAHYQF